MPGDLLWLDNDSLLLPFSGSTFVDRSPRQNIVLPTGDSDVLITSSIADPFGQTNGVAIFDGLGGYIAVNSANLIGTGDFTVEAFIRPSTVSIDQCIFCIGNIANGGQFDFGFEISAVGILRGFIRDGAGNTNIDISSASNSIAVNTWQYVVARSSGSTFELFINGTQAAVGSISGTRAQGRSDSRVGFTSTAAPRNFNGYISQLRVTRGVARSVSVPSAPFPDYVESITPYSPVLGNLIGAGDNYNGEVGFSSTSTYQLVDSSCVGAKTGVGFSIYLRGNGEQLKAGSNFDGTGGSTFYSFAVDKTSIKHIAAGNGAHAVISNAEVLTAYGLSAYGFSSVTLPSASNKLVMAGKTIFVLLDNGNLYGVGEGSLGQFGIGGTSDLPTLTTVNAGVKDIACSPTHALLLKINGDLYVAGNNDIGQLGFSDLANRSTWTLAGTGFKAIAACEGVSFAIKDNGDLYGAGSGSIGNFGDGASQDYDVFTLLDTGYKKVACYPSYTLAIKSNGDLYGAGSLQYGRFGIGTTTDLFPAFVSLSQTNVIDAAVNERSSFLIQESVSVSQVRWPKFLISGTASVAVPNQFYAPKFNISGNIGARGSISLVMPGIFGTFYSISDKQHNLFSPRFSVSGNAGAIGSITLKMPSIVGSILPESHAAATIKMPMPSISGIARHELVASGSISWPSFAVISNWNGSISWPIFSISGHTLTPPATSAYCLNIRTGEMTRFTNYSFIDVLNIAGKQFGLREDGLYLIDGDMDIDTPINGKIKTKNMDFGSFNSKRVYYAYLNSDTATTIMPIVDGIAKSTMPSSFGGRKTHLARGNSGRYWQFEIGNIVRLEGIEILPEQRQRRVK